MSIDTKRHELRTANGPLFAIGDTNLLDSDDTRPRVLVTGARRATPYGTAIAEQAGRIAASAGCVVVTGGALGCENAAVRGALEGGAPVVAWLMGGLGSPYPKSNAELFDRVLERGGLLLSYEPWDMPPRPVHGTQRRERMVELVDAVLVCEAGLPSGTFTMCDKAMELGKRVLAAPGNITAQHSAGSNLLLASGAEPVWSLAHLCGALEELRDDCEKEGSE